MRGKNLGWGGGKNPKDNSSNLSGEGKKFGWGGDKIPKRTKEGDYERTYFAMAARKSSFGGLARLEPSKWKNILLFTFYVACDFK